MQNLTYTLVQKTKTALIQIYRESSYLSILLKVMTLPFLCSTSKSKDLLDVPPPLCTRAKFTQDISSKRIWTGGLGTNMKPRSSG